MTTACEFPTGAALDRLVLWTIAQMVAQEPKAETWGTTITFYALREYELTWAINEQYYNALVSRSIDRLQNAGLVNFDEHLGYRLREMKEL